LNVQGRLTGHTTGNNVDGTTNFIPKMDGVILREGYRSLMRHIYSPGPYYQRIRTFLREYQRPKVSRPIDWRYVLAFLHANIRLGVLGCERFHYWGLLLWTVFRRPSHFPLAVTLSIYGHHFRRTCKVLGL